MSHVESDIEQTLRVEREDAERQIAKYRVWVGAALTSSGIFSYVFTNAGRLPSALITFLFFCTLFPISIGLRSLVLRYGTAAWLRFILLLFDLCALPGYFSIMLLLGLAGDPTQRAEGILWSVYTFAPTELTFLSLSALRASGAAAVTGAAIAAAMYALSMVTGGVWHPAQPVVVMVIVLNGLIGVAIARRARRSLDTFARLHLLRKFVSSSAADRVLQASPEVAGALGGRQAMVTLVSTDLRDFTSLSEQHSPDEVVRQLNGYHGAMVEQVVAHGGEIDKFIGDGMLAIFGLRTEQADQGAQAAVDCARKMLASLAQLNVERQAAGFNALRMGIGIHTGPVIAGNIGAPGRLEFTVIGDAVNTAARLEGFTKQAPSPIVASDETVRRLSSTTGLTALPAAELKGKARVVAVYAVSP